ncbi:uncharacterized protein PV09_09306 [Verruconis gallopava]|uniref:Cohesin loading factor n=1 Tax=Verruconis gallopava TaxID=253628 RepID=A0A0D1X9Z6_9PEZI|nr:uncharacterized protein PV09_09306 [Verruconis gallopava]KIV98980.1 hypothetical protein PV09_09306 [Verruconis gallopava]
MNYNGNYVDYQVPSGGIYDSGFQNEDQNPYNFQEVGQTSHMMATYGERNYAPSQDDAYQTMQYQHSFASSPARSLPAHSPQSMIMITQRTPTHALANSPPMSNPSTAQPSPFHHVSPLRQLHHVSQSHPQPQPQPQDQSQPQPQPQPQPPGLNYDNFKPTLPLHTVHHSHPLQQATSSTFQTIPQGQPWISKAQAIVEVPMQSSRYLRDQTHSLRSLDHVAVSLTNSASPQNSANTSANKRARLPITQPLDYQQILLLLAEDYINAAHDMSSYVAYYRRNDDIKEYHILLAIGLRCLEASLVQFRLAPRVEALIVLQYTNLMLRETRNYEEVDKWLSKTIPLCERNKLLDVKYSMHHLAARALFATRPRVAIRSLDAAISFAHAHKHTPWIYALRFLRLSFSYKLDASSQDFTAGIQNVKVMSELASSEDDGAISLICATYSALLHLRSKASNCIEEAQHAIAAAKSFQFHPIAAPLRQIWALLACVEIVCYLMEGSPSLAAQKAEQMASIIDEIRASTSLGDDGLLAIPLRQKPGSLTETTCGIFQRRKDQEFLSFKWLAQRDLWAFCFLLNAIASQSRTFADQKAEAYLSEGLKILKENLSESSLSREDIFPSSSSLDVVINRLDWWYNMQWFFYIYMSINACGRTDWSKAEEYLTEARACPPASILDCGPSRVKWEMFLCATIQQGRGQIEEALSIFQSPALQLPATANNGLHDVETDLGILAALNSVLIMLDPTNSAHSEAARLHEFVSSSLINHPNKSLRAAHDLLRSVLNPQGKLIDKKKHFASCLNAARAVNNTQLVSIALSLMCTMFFKDVVGEQAQKSVRSARALADRSGSMLWKGVAAGLQEQTALRHGSDDDAANARKDRDVFIDALPDAVKSRFALSL